MTFGFPAYYTEQYSAETDNSADLRAAVKGSLNALSWFIREEKNDQIIAATGVNIWSWGEKILIDFLSDNSILITSKCALPVQCLDWGKNKANVGRFMAEIRKYF